MVPAQKTRRNVRWICRFRCIIASAASAIVWAWGRFVSKGSADPRVVLRCRRLVPGCYANDLGPSENGHEAREHWELIAIGPRMPASRANQGRSKSVPRAPLRARSRRAKPLRSGAVGMSGGVGGGSSVQLSPMCRSWVTARSRNVASLLVDVVLYGVRAECRWACSNLVNGRLPTFRRNPGPDDVECPGGRRLCCGRLGRSWFSSLSVWSDRWSIHRRRRRRKLTRPQVGRLDRRLGASRPLGRP